MTAPDVPSRPSEANLLHKYVHDRLTNLWAARAILRRQLNAEWTVRRWECETELRALLTLARKARRTAAEVGSGAATLTTPLYEAPQLDASPPVLARPLYPVEPGQIFAGLPFVVPDQADLRIEVDPEFNPGWVMGPDDDQPWYDPDFRRPESADPLTAAKSFHDWQAAAPDVDRVWSEAQMLYVAGR